MKPLLCLAIFTFLGVAQTFELGSSLDDVYLKSGVPKSWWVPEARRYLNGFEEYRAAMAAGTVIQDVYERKTATNTYEIHLIRRADSREWLHPPNIRLSGLEFLVEKPGTFRELLRDIAEASHVCAAGCNLYGLDDTNRYSILAYPIDPIAGETQQATAAANGYKPDFKPAHTYNWGLKLYFKKAQYLRKSQRPAEPDWVNSKIESVQIRPTSSDYELRTWTGQSQPQPLGSWKP